MNARAFKRDIFASPAAPVRPYLVNFPYELLSKLLKGGYIGDYIEDYYRVYLGEY